MNRKLKLIVATLLAIAILVPMPGRANAAFDSYYHSSYRKLLYTSGQYTEGSYWYNIKAYDANMNYTYSCQICRLNTPFRVDNVWKSYNTGDQTMAVSQGITVSSTHASSSSHNINASISAKASFTVLKKGIEATAQVGYSYTRTTTNSYTTTYQDTQTYSTTFNKNTANGIYYYAAIRYYDAQEVEVYGRRAYSNEAWRKLDEYTVFFNKYSYPVIVLVKDPL